MARLVPQNSVQLRNNLDSRSSSLLQPKHQHMFGRMSGEQQIPSLQRVESYYGGLLRGGVTRDGGLRQRFDRSVF